MVERNLAKVDVEGSSPFARFSNSNPKHHASGFLLNSYYINPLSQTLLSDSVDDFVGYTVGDLVGDSVGDYGGDSVARICLRVPSRWKVLSGEFRRRPTSLAVKLRKPDRVGRRGLFEPREDISRLHTYAWTQMWFVQNLAAD